jgi:hypothetical protein
MSGTQRPIRVPAEQAAAEADQAAADLDQRGSDADQAGSDADQRDAERDQAVSDHDQARADRDYAALVNVSPNQKRDFDAARAERLADSAARSETRKQRARSAMKRAVSAGRRDRTSDDRDARSNMPVPKPPTDGAPEAGSQSADRIGLREPGFFRWAWQRIGTEIPDLRPGQANLVIEGEAHTQRVIARLIVERSGLDVQAPGDDPVEAVENLVRVLR